MSLETYNETRAAVNTFEDGKTKRTVLEEESAQELVESTKESDHPAEVIASQSFTFYRVSVDNPLQDLADLVNSTEEQANIINRAIVLKQQQYVRKVMIQDNFTPVEGNYDLRDVVGQVSEGRVAASIEEKAARALSKLLGRSISTEQLAEIIAQMHPASA